MATRPAWFNADRFPVESHWVDIDGHSVHYVDEGEGPAAADAARQSNVELLVPPVDRRPSRTGSVASRSTTRGSACPQPNPDTASPRPSTPMSSARSSANWICATSPRSSRIGAGPIGLAAATREPERFSSLIVGNTWAWPHDTKTAERFSFLMGSEKTGDWLSRKLNLFVGQIIPRSMRRRSLKPDEMAMYKGPFPDEESRIPVQVFPREIMGSHAFLAELESNLSRIASLPSLLLWANKDMAFGKPEMERWQSLLANHHFHMLQGAGHYWQDDAGEEAVLAIRNWWDHLR